MNEDKFFSEQEEEQAEKFLEAIVGSFLQAVGETVEGSGVVDNVKDVRGAAEGAAVDALSEVIGFLKQAQDSVGTALDEMQTGIAEAKKKTDLARYRPIKPEELEEKLAQTQMLVIADPEPRKGIEVCEGEVAWQAKQGKLDVLYLYESAVEQSGIDFQPRAALGDVFIRDKFDSKSFYNVGSFVKHVNEEQIAEIKELADKLGAKSCEIKESEEERIVSIPKVVPAAEPEAAAEAATEAAAAFEDQIEAAAGVAEDFASGIEDAFAAFMKIAEGEAEPEPETELDPKLEEEAAEAVAAVTGEAKSYAEIQAAEPEPEPEPEDPNRPKLVWFKDDPAIKDLIDSRLGVDGKIPADSYRLEVSGEACVKELTDLAAKADSALKAMGAGEDFSLAADVASQALRKYVVDIKF